MNFNTYTQKSIEAVQLAQSIARTRRNQQLEQLHLLSALLTQEGGLTPQLLKKMGVVVKRAKYFITCCGRYYGDVDIEPDRIRGMITGAADGVQLSLFGMGVTALGDPGAAGLPGVGTFGEGGVNGGLPV